MKINKKGYLMKLILNYNLNDFDPKESEEEVTFEERCFKGVGGSKLEL